MKTYRIEVRGEQIATLTTGADPRDVLRQVLNGRAVLCEQAAPAKPEPKGETVALVEKAK